MYEELKKQLKELGLITEFCGEQRCFECKNKDLCDKYENKMLSDVYKNAADAIERLELEVDVLKVDKDDLVNENRKLMEAWQNAMGGQKWISVEAQPPFKVGDEGYTGYLVYANGYYEVADYTTDKFDNIPCFHVDGEYEPDVTHFMPLPEPPKEGDNK